MGRQCYLYLLLLTTYIFFSQVRNVRVLSKKEQDIFLFSFNSPLVSSPLQTFLENLAVANENKRT